jgi:hypothetical protein
MNKSINEYTVIELKAMGFDILNQMEFLKQQFGLINQELKKREDECKNVDSGK